MDYTTRNRPELLALCKERGLSGAGTTDDLIARLEAQDAETAGQGVDDDPLGEDPDADQTPPEVESQPKDTGAGTARITSAEASPAPPETPPDATPAAELSGDGKAAKPADRGPDPKVTEGPTGNVYRFQFYADRQVDDELHRHFIAETHHNARAAGHETKGYPTAGHRVRYSADAAGKPTVVYEVYLAGSKPNGLRR